MDNFKAVYKILSALEKAMDYPEFDINDVGPEALGVCQRTLGTIYRDDG